MRDFSLGAARILARAVPFDGVCVLTMDPATLAADGRGGRERPPAGRDGPHDRDRDRGGGLQRFSALARAGRRAASLSEATGGELDRSLRHRELRRPNGFGDELRAVLAGDSATWGGFTLLRGSDRDHFTPADAALVASCRAISPRG